LLWFDLPNVAIAAIVLAMEWRTRCSRLPGGAGLGLTYVTGALIKVGQLAAEALTGGARWGWASKSAVVAALWRVPCAVRSPITGSISPRSGLPPLLRWR